MVVFSEKTEARRLARQNWPVRKYRLGEEPSDDLSGSTTVQQRIAMMWPLAAEAWEVAGLPIPTYGRRETPVVKSFRVQGRSR